MMGRREFITLVGGAAATAAVSWPHTASAQQAAKLRTIGFMGATAPAAVSTWVAAFVQGLRERTLHPPGQLLGPPSGGSAFARPTDLGSSVELHYFLLACLGTTGCQAAHH